MNIDDLTSKQWAALELVAHHHGGIREDQACKVLGMDIMHGRAILRSLITHEVLSSAKAAASPVTIYCVTSFGQSVINGRKSASGTSNAKRDHDAQLRRHRVQAGENT